MTNTHSCTHTQILKVCTRSAPPLCFLLSRGQMGSCRILQWGFSFIAKHIGGFDCEWLENRCASHCQTYSMCTNFLSFWVKLHSLTSKESPNVWWHNCHSYKVNFHNIVITVCRLVQYQKLHLGGWDSSTGKMKFEKAVQTLIRELQVKKTLWGITDFLFNWWITITNILILHSHTLLSYNNLDVFLCCLFSW